MIQLANMHLGRAMQVGPLALFPIWTDAPVPRHRPYSTTGGTVAELPIRPKVNGLQVTHPGPKPLLLLEGALLGGGWQHRALVRDVLIAPGHSREIEVRCVEAGRWHGEMGQEFERRCAPLAIRAALRGIRAEGRDDHADQGDVWRRVDAYQHRLGGNPTSSLLQLQRGQEERIRPMVQQVRPLFGQRGVLIGAGGEPVLLEVFDHPRTLAEFLPVILAACLLDATGTTFMETRGVVARAFVNRVQQLGLQAVDRGQEAVFRRAEDEVVDVQALSGRDGVIHLGALNLRHELVLVA